MDVAEIDVELPVHVDVFHVAVDVVDAEGGVGPHPGGRSGSWRKVRPVDDRRSEFQEIVAADRQDIVGRDDVRRKCRREQRSQLVDAESGLINFRFGFFFELSGSPRFKIFRYNSM